MLTVGDQAPEFELLSAEHKPVKLSDFRGERIVLFFYPKADTPGCKRQACGFRDNWDVIREAGATVIGISPDEPFALSDWKRKEALPYTLLSDPEHKTAEEYGVWGEKKLYGRAYMGIIRSHFIIDEEGKLLDVQIKVSPAKSVEAAMAFLS